MFCSEPECRSAFSPVHSGTISGWSQLLVAGVASPSRCSAAASRSDIQTQVGSLGVCSQIKPSYCYRKLKDPNYCDSFLCVVRKCWCPSVKPEVGMKICSECILMASLNSGWFAVCFLWFDLVLPPVPAATSTLY